MLTSIENKCKVEQVSSIVFHEKLNKAENAPEDTCRELFFTCKIICLTYLSLPIHFECNCFYFVKHEKFSECFLFLNESSFVKAFLWFHLIQEIYYFHIKNHGNWLVLSTKKRNHIFLWFLRYDEWNKELSIHILDIRIKKVVILSPCLLQQV